MHLYRTSNSCAFRHKASFLWLQNGSPCPGPRRRGSPILGPRSEFLAIEFAPSTCISVKQGIKRERINPVYPLAERSLTQASTHFNFISPPSRDTVSDFFNFPNRRQRIPLAAIDPRDRSRGGIDRGCAARTLTGDEHGQQDEKRCGEGRTRFPAPCDTSHDAFCFSDCTPTHRHTRARGRPRITAPRSSQDIRFLRRHLLVDPFTVRTSLRIQNPRAAAELARTRQQSRAIVAGGRLPAVQGAKGHR